jgi:hypothetical protein
VIPAAAVAYQERTADVLWTYHASGAVKGARTATHGLATGFASHGNLWAFDPRTGRKVWHLPDGWYSTAAAGLDRMVVTGTRALYLPRPKG